MRAVDWVVVLGSALVASPARADGLVSASAVAQLTLPKKPLEEGKISYSGDPLPNVTWRDGFFAAQGGACFRYDADAAGESSSDVHLADSHVGPTGRVQRITGQGADARLEVYDAWLDATAGRSYVKRTTRVALTPIATGPGGVTAYAYRIDTRVHVLVRTRPRWAGDCGLSHVSLDLGARDGDEGRTVVILDDRKRIRLSASVSRFGGEPRLSATFVVR